MDVFISWSGEPSKTFASVLRDFVQDVIQLSKPFMSEHDLGAGTRWAHEISKKLSTTHVGIACITPDNMHSDWLLFEAGALTKRLEEGRLCTCLFGVDPLEVTGPLSQFQANTADEKGIWSIIETVNKALGDSQLETDRLKRAFESHWPSCEKRLNEITLDPAECGAEPRTIDNKIDEMLSILRRLEKESVIGTRGSEARGKGNSNLMNAIMREYGVEELNRLLRTRSSSTMSTSTATTPPKDDDIPENFIPDDP